jgi:glycosyltransferase involved in cell wall biosynthesis
LPAGILPVTGVDVLETLSLPADTFRKNVRVLFLTHYYPPELGAAQTRIAALAHGLGERGVDVTVHTGFPHYPSGRVAPLYRNRLLGVEREGPVRVLRSVIFPAPNRGFARRLTDHTAFAAGALLTSPAAGPVDVVVAETPPLFTAVAGAAYARLKGAALALNVSDLWPESAIELGMLSHDGQAARAANMLARLCYRDAELITAPTRGIVESLRARPEVGGKVVHVPPAVDLERFAAVAERAPGADRPQPDPSVSANAPVGLALDPPLRVLYAGTLGMAQGLETLVRAAALAGPEVVELLIAGTGPQEQHLRALIASRGLSNVRLLGAVAPTEIPTLYGEVDAGIVPLRDLPIFTGALPTKLFEVLAAGRPLIVAARGEAAELVRSSEAGIAVAPEDPLALVEAFRRLQGSPRSARRMGARGRLFARRFDRSAVIEQWHGLLDELAANASNG